MTHAGNPRHELPRWSAVSSPEPSPAPVVAAFDVDGTVTTRDCVVPFLLRVAGAPRLVGGLLRQAHRTVPALARRDRNTLKALAARVAFRGRSADAVTQQATAFAAEVLARRLRPDTLARLRWHQAAGHTVVFVSASFACYLRPLAEAMGVDDVIGTELVHLDGTLTGELAGDNCRGVEKRRRLHDWLEARGGRSAVTLWAYGDSAGDAELLADADTAVWARDPIPAMVHR